jgi:site-specific DNA-methyltransferase (adenine-specific)
MGESMTFNTKGLMSSFNHEWRTPKRIYEILEAEFHFDFDPCPQNPKFDGLNIAWGACNFVNPPFKHISKWIKKGYEEWQLGKTIVFLIPSRTDTRYWHDYIMKATEIRFIKGRLCFNDCGKPAPFPSAIIVFKA